MSVRVLDFEGLVEDVDVDAKGIGGGKGRDETCDSASENWPCRLAGCTVTGTTNTALLTNVHQLLSTLTLYSCTVSFRP